MAQRCTCGRWEREPEALFSLACYAAADHALAHKRETSQSGEHVLLLARD
jgi:hypothetical protein